MGGCSGGVVGRAMEVAVVAGEGGDWDAARRGRRRRESSERRIVRVGVRLSFLPESISAKTRRRFGRDESFENMPMANGEVWRKLEVWAAW